MESNTSNNEKEKKFEYDYSKLPALDDNSPENLKKTNDLIDAIGKYYGYDKK